MPCFFRILLLNFCILQSACSSVLTNNYSSEHELNKVGATNTIDREESIHSSPTVAIDRQEICHLIKDSLFDGIALKEEALRGKSISEVKWPPFDAELFQYFGKLTKNTCRLKSTISVDVDNDGVNEIFERLRLCMRGAMSESFSIYDSNDIGVKKDLRFNIGWTWADGPAGFITIDDEISSQSKQLEQYDSVNLHLPLEISMYTISNGKPFPLIRISTKFSSGEYLGHLFSFFERKKDGSFKLNQTCFFDGGK